MNASTSSPAKTTAAWAAPLRKLVGSSIRQQTKRSGMQILLVAAVVVTGGACLVAGRGGGQAIVDSVETSGAALYRISANNRDTNNAEAVDASLLERLTDLDGINYVSAQAQFKPVVSSAAKPSGVQRQVLAVSPSYLTIQGATVVVGNPALADNSAGYGALLGPDAATELGVTQTCVLAQTCTITIDQTDYLVSAIIDAPGLANGIFIDLAPATSQEVVDGPAEIVVSSNGLPAATTRRSLDLIASATTDQIIFVREPAAAAELREGVSATWRTTIAAMAVLVLAMGVAGQIAIQRAIVRSRHTEIATLRSIGYPPRFIITQFIAEPFVLAAGGAVVGFATLAAAAAISRITLSYDLDLPPLSAAVLAANALIVSAGASMLAANSASKVSPAEILHQ